LLVVTTVTIKNDKNNAIPTATTLITIDSKQPSEKGEMRGRRENKILVHAVLRKGRILRKYICL
jgi:hypothetical protein